MIRGAGLSNHVPLTFERNPVARDLAHRETAASGGGIRPEV
jgi:hypothetical protein